MMSFYFLCFCLLQVFPAFATKTTKECLLDPVVLKNLETQYEVKISIRDYNITYDEMDVVTKPSSEGGVLEIQLGSADVVVAGHLYPKEDEKKLKIRHRIDGKMNEAGVLEIELGADDVVVPGHLYPEKNENALEIEWKFNAKSLVLKRKVETLSDGNEKIICNLVKSKHGSKRNALSQENLSPSEKVDLVLQGLTEACLEIQICEQYHRGM